MPEPMIDIAQQTGNGFTASGSAAQRLMQSGFNVNALRTNDTLRKDEWELFDETVVEVARERLVGVGDLIERNLRLDVANPLGTTPDRDWETGLHQPLGS